MKIARSAIAAASLLVSVASARATVVLSDPFTDGNRNGGADNSGVAWFDRSANATTTIVNDASGIGSGNALLWNPTTTTAVTARGYTGVFTGSNYVLATVGDFIEIKMDFRFAPTVIGASTTTSPVSNATGVTFGLYNSNGTVITADDSTGQDNDFGYRAELGSGTTSAVFIGREQNSGAGGTGTTTSGDTTAVTLDGGSTPVAINDFLKHSLLFRMTRSSTGIDFVVGYDGGTVATATSTTTPLFNSIDEIVMSQGSGNAFYIDNFSLTSSVPEPSTAGLVAAAAASLLMDRRRKHPPKCRVEIG